MVVRIGEDGKEVVDGRVGKGRRLERKVTRGRLQWVQDELGRIFGSTV